LHRLRSQQTLEIDESIDGDDIGAVDNDVVAHSHAYCV
jgi:hypothetical protein